MSDIGSLATKTALVATAVGGAAAVSVGEVGLEGVPARLSQLFRPVVITGTVIGQADDGTTRVRTQAGEVVLRTGASLPADSSVTLQIGAGQPPTRANVFLTSQAGNAAIAGTLAQLPNLGAEEPAPASVSGAGGKFASIGADGHVPAPGTVVPAQVLSSPVPPSQGASAQVLSGGLPAVSAPASSAASLVVAGAAGQGQPPQGPVSGPIPQAVTLSLVPGATVAVRILGADGGGGAMEAGSGRVLAGTIAGSTNSGQPVLVTSQGSLSLAVRGPLPQGMKLLVELVDPRQLVFAHPADGGAAGAGAQRWPALFETFAALGGPEGALVQSLLGTIVPRPNRKLAAALAFFLDRVRHGDARGWLGEEATGALEKDGRGDELARLTDDFRAAAREAAETPPGEWRPLAIPVWDGAAFQRVELYVKALRDDAEQGDRKGVGERSHRFILDLDLSRFGALQLDGLVKQRRFDLILRSHCSLPDALRGDLSRSFSASLDAVGFSGGLAFQAGSRNWVKPPPVGRRSGPGVVA